MTIEEAKKNIKAYVYMEAENIPKQVIEALEVFRQTAEKQIPKKPDVEGDGYADGNLVYDTWICPYCEKNYEIGYDIYKYCPHCGQAIDRSKLKEYEE